MKKNLGKILFLLLLLESFVVASSLASYSLHSQKVNLFEREPVVLSFEAIQKDTSDNMYFLLKAKKSDLYSISLLNKEIENSSSHKNTTTFTYILFPKTYGEISVNFDFIIQTASDKAVAQSYVDDHDDSVATQTHNTTIQLEPLVLNVKKLLHKVDIVGDFTLNSSINSDKITQYDDVNLLYKLQGRGEKLHLGQLIKNIPNVTIFSDKQDIVSKLTKDGYVSNKEFIYAFSSRENFTIPSITLKAYSPKKKTYYSLSTPPYPIKVAQIDAKTLLDKKNFPQKETLIDIEFIQKIAIYILLFVSGFITAKVSGVSLLRKRKGQKYQDIYEAKSAQALLFVLLHNYQKERMQNTLNDLESLLSHKSSKTFSQIKKELLKSL